MIKKRILFCAIITLLIYSILIGRFAQLQLISTENFTERHINLLEESVEQRTQTMVLDNGRGRFIDRNGKALTHDYYPSLILFPFLKDTDWPIDKVAKIIDVPVTNLQKSISSSKEPFVFGGAKPFQLTDLQMKKINNLKIPGVFVVYQQHKLEERIADHLLGIVRENDNLLEKRYKQKLKNGVITYQTKVGITGLESAFDEFLLPEGEAKLLFHVDRRGEPMFGLNVKYTAPANPFYPTAIKTTIDKPIQKMIENIVDKENLKKGGVVLLDIETSNLLSIVSRPQMKKHDPFANDGAINQMISSQIPGSIFKIVTAAAAIENNKVHPKRMFNCNLNLYGDGSASRQLGQLSFKESFAQSCNYTFATLAQELIENDRQVIESYAEKLGLIGEVAWQGNVFHFENFEQLTEEDKGSIWKNHSDKHVDKAIAQTAIGQKEVRVTPLAVANMMATIARGGEKKQVRAVSDILYKNGTTLFSFPQKQLQGENLTRYGSMKLQELLREVVKSGTGVRFKSLPYRIAGKSGTAETGKGNLVNKWFAGYFPADNPKYALVVVDIEQDSDVATTYSVFEQVVKGIYEMDHKTSNPK